MVYSENLLMCAYFLKLINQIKNFYKVIIVDSLIPSYYAL